MNSLNTDTAQPLQVEGVDITVALAVAVAVANFYLFHQQAR